MKSSKSNGLSRLIAFVMIAVLLICAIGFAANGWQSSPNDEPDSGDVGGSADNTDENTDGNTNNNQNQDNTANGENTENTPPEEILPPAPVYINNITGLEISEEENASVPLGYVINPNLPIYGISSSDLSIEFPIENGSTRLLNYTKSSSLLWKIGSVMPTRDYISGMTKFFGGITVSKGNDDIVKYSSYDTTKSSLDLSLYTDCYYIENHTNAYTSKDMLNVALNRNESLQKEGYKTPPYIFSEENTVTGNKEAKSVIIPYSSSSETEFYYSESTGNYLYFKSGTRKVDMLSGKNAAFKNLFILFANATTYEKSEGTELVMDTISGGSGYYFTNGTMTEIKWSVDENGNLSFKTLSGETLTVNKGNAYIGYFKASSSSSVKYF